VAFSPDGKQVVSGSWDNTVRLWDAATGTALQTLEGHLSSVASVAFSPDGKQVVSGSWDNIVRLWDAATGTALQRLEGLQLTVSGPTKRSLEAAEERSQMPNAKKQRGTEL
jgi:WD40 repeat protein